MTHSKRLVDFFYGIEMSEKTLGEQSFTFWSKFNFPKKATLPLKKSKKSPSTHIIANFLFVMIG